MFPPVVGAAFGLSILHSGTKDGVKGLVNLLVWGGEGGIGRVVDV